MFEGPLSFKLIYILISALMVIVLGAYIAGAMIFSENPLTEGHKLFLNNIWTVLWALVGFLLGGFSGYVAKATGSTRT